MKGSPSQTIKDFNDDYMNTYEELFNDKVIKFNITKYCPLELLKNYTAINRTDFTRTIQFISGKKNLVC
jgi:hypothetical protein